MTGYSYAVHAIGKVHLLDQGANMTAQLALCGQAVTGYTLEPKSPAGRSVCGNCRRVAEADERGRHARR